MKRFFIVIAVVVILAGVVFSLNKYISHQELIAPSFDYSTIPQSLMSQSYSREDVAKHNKASDCWMVIAEKVFNVTPEIKIHPGGRIISIGCGRDATSLFYMYPSSGQVHGSRAINDLRKLYVGELKK